MCNPAFIAALPYITAAVSAAAAVGGTIMANNAQNDLVEAEANASNKAARFDYQRLMEQGSQINDQAAHEKLQRQLQAARERGRLRVAQGQAGVGGMSSMAMLNNVIMQEGYDSSILEANRSGSIRQANAEMQGIQAGAEGRSNVARAGSVSPMTGYMQAGMAGINGAAEGYSTGKTLGKAIPVRQPRKVG